MTFNENAKVTRVNKASKWLILTLVLQAPDVKLRSTKREEEAMDYDDDGDDNHEDDNANRNQSGNQSSNQVTHVSAEDAVELRPTPKPRRRPHGIHE